MDVFLLLVVLCVAAKGEANENSTCGNERDGFLQGQKTWHLQYSDLEPSRELQCKWDVRPPDRNHIIFIQFFDLYLLTENGHCAAYLVLNGVKRCRMPEPPCFIFRKGGDPGCQYRPIQESWEGKSCKVENWKERSSSIFLVTENGTKLKAHKHLIHLFYTYLNCTNEGFSILKRNLLPDDSDKATTSTTTTTTSTTTVAITIPLAVATVLIVAIVLFIAFRRSRNNANAKDVDLGGLPSKLNYGASNDCCKMEERRYEIIDDFRQMNKDNSAVNTEKTIVDNIIYNTTESSSPP